MIPNDKKSELVAKFQSKNKTPKFNDIKPEKKVRKNPLHKQEYYGEDFAEVTTVLKYHCGIHYRPASFLVNIAEKFNSKIQLKAKGKSVDAKSILMIMSLGIVYDTEITISATGSDACEAVKALIDRIDLMSANDSCYI